MTASHVFHDFSPVASRFADDVLRGLRCPHKSLSPKYFYDDIGSTLFEAICALPEYYPTRTETKIMQTHAAAMAECLGRRCALIEFGSGVSRKTRLLLAATSPSVYVPIDIACETLRGAAASLEQEFPQLPIEAVCADYSSALELPPLARYGARRRVIFFPGSTIGNFDPEESIAFLSHAAHLAGPGGGLLVGVDLRKDKAVLEAAYDDPIGVTAAFNLNLLARINRELGADFDVRAFRHRARYSEARGRVEMYLESCRDQAVRIGDEAIAFRAGETIHTESSYKYTVQEFQALAACSGFRACNYWVDEARLFSIHYMEC
jgi:dimethylhistidine N-methyltransferase